MDNIERTRTRGKLLKLGQNILLKNNVLVLKFDKYGILQKKEFYDRRSINDLEFSKNKTVGIDKKQDFIFSFLSSVRQKMFRGKNK